MSTLEEFRSDKVWDHTFDYAQQVARHLKIDIVPPSTCQRKSSRRLQNSFVLESTGSREELSTSQEYKVHFYYCVLDSFLSQLRNRFTQQKPCTPERNSGLFPPV